MFSSGSDISGTIAKAVAAAARASCLKSMVVEIGVVAMQKKRVMQQSTICDSMEVEGWESCRSGFEVEDAESKRELELGRQRMAIWVARCCKKAVKRCDDALSLAVRD